VSETFRVGLLGHGTVGRAFAELLAERAGAIEPITGLRPEISGILTRSRGSFDEVLAGSDLIVELMGGIDPAREYVLAAMRAGKHVVSANKQLLAAHGEELWACAREHGVQLRFEGAVAGVVPVIRVLQESLAASRVERIHGIVNGTTNYILTEMARSGLSYEEALGQAQELDTRRPTRPTTSPAATPPPRWRSSRGSRSRRRSTSTRSSTRASST
jgi:homoserine dehydrogenase